MLEQVIRLFVKILDVWAQYLPIIPRNSLDLEQINFSAVKNSCWKVMTVRFISYIGTRLILNSDRDFAAAYRTSSHFITSNPTELFHCCEVRINFNPDTNQLTKLNTYALAWKNLDWLLLFHSQSCLLQAEWNIKLLVAANTPHHK